MEEQVKIGTGEETGLVNHDRQRWEWSLSRREVGRVPSPIKIRLQLGTHTHTKSTSIRNDPSPDPSVDPETSPRISTPDSAFLFTSSEPPVPPVPPRLPVPCLLSSGTPSFDRCSQTEPEVTPWVSEPRSNV